MIFMLEDVSLLLIWYNDLFHSVFDIKKTNFTNAALPCRINEMPVHCTRNKIQ